MRLSGGQAVPLWLMEGADLGESPRLYQHIFEVYIEHHPQDSLQKINSSFLVLGSFTSGTRILRVIRACTRNNITILTRGPKAIRHSLRL